MKTILVTGSTGPQGRAAIKSLLDAVTGDPAGVSEPAFRVIAITRNARSPAAQTLRQIGGERLELFQCNLDDKEALKAVFEEIKKKEEHIFGVFCVLSSVYPIKDTSSEERQGKAVIDCAIEYGVEHFVYSSMEHEEVQDDQPPPNCAAKIAIEKYLKEKARPNTAEDPLSSTSANGQNSTMCWTILRPAFFMLNFLEPAGKVVTGVLREGLKPDTAIQLVAMEDIGNTVRVVLQNSELYAYQTFTVASQALTADERDRAYSRAFPPPAKAAKYPGAVSRKRMPSIPAFMSHVLIKWSRPIRDMCEDLEKAHASHLRNGNGNSVANLQTVRTALSQYGMMSFEEFCARNFPGGRFYAEVSTDKSHQATNVSKGWRNVSVLGLFHNKA